MSRNVIMPQMGESITEGTVVRWARKVGERVEKDEILFEISTDKVDAEIPSHEAGILLEILVGEGQTVPVDTVVARLGTAEEAAQGAAAPAAPVPAAAAEVAHPAQAAPIPKAADLASAGLEELRRQRSSPLVRRMAAEHGVDLANLQGTGLSGRVTRQDLVRYLEVPAAAPAPAKAAPAAPVVPAPVPTAAPVAPAGAAAPAARPPAVEGGRLEPLSPMRKAIAHHMVQSRDTSVHVTTVFEVDFTRVVKLRRKHKEAYASRGLSLTFMPFIMKALTQALQEHPKVNSSLEGEALRYHDHVNLGVAVALDWGLLVPVVKSAEDLSLSGLARAVADLSGRARTKKLSPDEVQGGTFTITNPGVFGSLFGTPILSQPQVAILCVGAIKKRVVVLDDEEETFGVRSMAILSLSFDHRVLDGADADRFMARVKDLLENFPEEAL